MTELARGFTGNLGAAILQEEVKEILSRGP